MDLLKKAEDIARKAHKNQTRWDPNEQYIIHPEYIVKNCKTEDSKIVAWLHDVIEDTNITITDLQKNFPENIIEAIIAMTKETNESYSKYIDRVKNNDIAKEVKIYDIEHNMSDLEYVTKEIDRIRKERYELALYILKGK